MNETNDSRLTAHDFRLTTVQPPVPILYEDNHLLAVNKGVSDIVQGDQTGDPSLDKLLKAYLKVREGKPGEVFLGIPHRLDRPVSGVVVYAKTSKALSRMAQLFKEKKVDKIYHVIVEKCPDPESGALEHYLTRNTRQNKSYAHHREVPGSKLARLRYRKLASSDHYHLLEVMLETGRHHQIRAQLAAIGCVIKGDRKYGARRSNKNGGISLHARKIAFIHPVRNESMEIVAPYPRMDIFPVFKIS